MACETRKTLDVIHKLKRFEDCSPVEQKTPSASLLC